MENIQIYTQSVVTVRAAVSLWLPDTPPPPKSTTSSHVIMGRGLQLYRLQGQGSPSAGIWWWWAGKLRPALLISQPLIDMCSHCESAPPPLPPYTHTPPPLFVTCWVKAVNTDCLFSWWHCACVSCRGVCVCEGVEGPVTHQR